MGNEALKKIKSRYHSPWRRLTREYKDLRFTDRWPVVLPHSSSSELFLLDLEKIQRVLQFPEMTWMDFRLTSWTRNPRLSDWSFARWPRRTSETILMRWDERCEPDEPEIKEHSFRKSTDWKSVSLFCQATIWQGKLTISQVYSNLSTFLFRYISSLQFGAVGNCKFWPN